MSRQSLRSPIRDVVVFSGVGASLTLWVVAFGVFKPVMVGLGLIAIVVLVMAFLVPRRWLLGLAASSMLLLPISSLPIAPSLKTIPPGVALELIWIGRTLIRAPRKSKVARFEGAAVVLFAAFLMASSLVSTSLTRGSLAWLFDIAVTLCVLLLVVVGFDPDVRCFASCIRWTTLCIALYAVVEAWILQNNVLFSYVPIAAHSSGVYRASATLGHPLALGAALSTGAAMWVGRFVYGNERRIACLVAVCIGICGVVSTLSRGSLVAIGFVSVLCVVLHSDKYGSRLGRRFTLGVILVSGAVLAMIVLEPRIESTEAQTSAQVHADVVSRSVVESDGHLLLGVGPGTSAAYGASLGYSIPQIESGYGEILVSAGAPALVSLLVLVCVTGINVWIRRGNSATCEVSLGGSALGIAAAGFNAFEGHVVLTIVLLLLIGCAAYRGNGLLEEGSPGQRAQIAGFDTVRNEECVG